MHQINPAEAQRIDDRTEWPARRATFAACSGDCHQGRRPCITPDACRLAEPDDMTEGMGAVVVPAVVAATLAVAALVAFLAGWL
jgi:hypothetical protein